MRKDMKIAVLIDAENISSKYANTILQEASGLGNVIYKRIYGNWTSSQLGSWKQELLDHAIQPIQQYSNTSGKNSSDSALIIDAMDLLYQNRLDAFCIVSSDSDFTRLASRLRESEMYVLGMGEQKTPRAFISACNKFVYLDVLAGQKKKRGTTKDSSRDKKRDVASSDRARQATDGDDAKSTNRRSAGAQSNRTDETSKTRLASSEKAAPAEIDVREEENIYSDGTDIIEVTDTLVNIIEEYSDDEGWIPASNLANLLSRRLSDFDTRNFGFKKFVPFVESLKIFEKRSVAVSNDPSVRAISFRLIED
jgi:hypothetical protein